MLFSSETFLCCALPLALAVYYLLPKSLRNGWLLIFSLFFYAWGEPVYLLLMLFSITVNWGIALSIGSARKGRHGLMILALVVNLGMLAVFKYAGFAAASFNALTGMALTVPAIKLPIGISFYTFQALSYVIDVYRGTPVEKSWGKTALYISLFPQLIAGPILRYGDIASQLDERRESFDGFAAGMSRFVCGLGKKVLIANVLAPLADEAFSHPCPATWTAWLGAAAYMMQIYFDFSGYSDMAIGLGRMFGFTYPENFFYPYTASSVRAFWQRWHITLSGWFRDYLYIPLGGSRRGKARQILALIIVFLATGLWHGAGWTFVLWGLYYGLLRGIEALTGKSSSGLFGHVCTLFLVLVGWVLFRAETVPSALTYFECMFRVSPGLPAALNARTIFVLFIAAVGSTPLPRALLGRIPTRLREPSQAVLTVAALILCMLSLISGAYNPFIYLRF